MENLFGISLERMPSSRVQESESSRSESEHAERLTWEDVYPNPKQRDSAFFDAKYFRNMDYSMRKKSGM